VLVGGEHTDLVWTAGWALLTQAKRRPMPAVY
jgi:hypothetical protein